MTLKVKNISCERGGKLLFEKLGFSLEAGRALHVRGENGSGKSSLFKIIALLNRPLDGDIIWENKSVLEESQHYFDNLLYVGHKNAINLQLTAVQNLLWYASIHSEDEGSDLISERSNHAFKLLGLYGLEDIPAKHLSAGQRRKILLARLILQNKKLWLLDEPFASLDSQSIEILQSLMSSHLAQGGLIVFSSHQEVKMDRHNPGILNLQQFQNTESYF